MYAVSHIHGIAFFVKITFFADFDTSCFHQGPRAQIDRDLYRSAMQHELIHNTPNLDIVAAAAEDLVIKGDQVEGVVLGNGRTVRTGQVVLTNGTFLRGVIHIGTHPSQSSFGCCLRNVSSSS
jgi:tRNA U34 5-carboxymethylaminomethyl modifying enzyme MnmG/GidA